MMEIDTKTKKNIAILALILIAALGFRFVFFMGVQKKRALTSGINEANEKITLLSSIAFLDKEIGRYEKALSKKISQGDLTDKVASLTKDLAIRVVSVTPQSKDDIGEYARLNMRLELEGSYPEVMRFLERIERDEAFIKVNLINLKGSYSDVNRWGGSFYELTQPGARSIQESLPRVSMEISALYKK